MGYDNHFLILDRDLIGDPNLSIFVLIARVFDEGDEGIWRIKILHDPNMTCDMRQKLSQLASSEGQESQPCGKLSFSDEYYCFFEFDLLKKTDGRILKWNVHALDESYPRINFFSPISKKYYECEDKKAFLIHVFKNLLLMPELHTWGKDKYDVAQVSISGLQFSFLKDLNPEDYRDPVVLDERKVVVQ